RREQESLWRKKRAGSARRETLVQIRSFCHLPGELCAPSRGTCCLRPFDGLFLVLTLFDSNVSYTPSASSAFTSDSEGDISCHSFIDTVVAAFSAQFSLVNVLALVGCSFGTGERCLFVAKPIILTERPEHSL